MTSPIPLLGSACSTLRAMLRAFRQKHKRHSGLPPGLGPDDVNTLKSKLDLTAVEAVSYEHLSGWKQSGAYRVFLKSASGIRTSIYKNSVYNEKEIPALQGLSVFPGPPEFFVYGCADRALGEYLPDVYMLRCPKAGRHYQYLLEDLGDDHVNPNGHDAIISVCNKLPRLYRDLANALRPQDHEHLLHFDAVFSENLLIYARENLKSYTEQKGADEPFPIMTQWDQLSEVYTSNLREIYGQSTLHPIHGDLNLTNIRMLKDKSDSLKFLDWEWAGIGGWWFDLVALLKSAPEVLEHNAVNQFLLASEIEFTVTEIRKYQWGKLQRGLFDASFFAKQILHSVDKAPTRIRLESHMERALGRAMHSLEWLQNH